MQLCHGGQRAEEGVRQVTNGLLLGASSDDTRVIRKARAIWAQLAAASRE